MADPHDQREFAQRLVGCFGLDNFTTEQAHDCIGEEVEDRLKENPHVRRTNGHWFVRAES